MITQVLGILSLLTIESTYLEVILALMTFSLLFKGLIVIESSTLAEAQPLDETP